MVSLVQLIIVAAVLTTVLGQNYNPNRATNGTQDYFKIAQAELLYKIKIAEMENDAVDARFLDRLAMIVLQQKQVLNETQQVNETLIPLQALNFVWKLCIQTYDSQFITNGAASDLFGACIKTAQYAGSSLTSYARSNTNAAKNYALVKLPMYLNTYCRSNNLTVTEQCYIKYVNVAVKEVQNYLNQAQLQRDQAIFEMNIISLNAVQCSYKVEKNVLDTLYSTSKKINDCIDGIQKQGNKIALN